MQINFFSLQCSYKGENFLVYVPESIKLFIEGQAFSRSNDLVPHLPPPPSSVSKLDRRHTGRLRNREKLLTVEQCWAQIRYSLPVTVTSYKLLTQSY